MPISLAPGEKTAHCDCPRPAGRSGDSDLDDSTSAVDFDTEVRLQAALDELMAGRTTFIVAQRISSVLKADQISMALIMARLLPAVPIAKLLASSPIYQEIYYSARCRCAGCVNGKLG